MFSRRDSENVRRCSDRGGRFVRVIGVVLAVAWIAAALTESPCVAQDRLVGTRPLTLEGDLAEQMIDGADRFLLREIAASVDRRENFWKRDLSSPTAYRASVAPNRKRFATMIGARDPRAQSDGMQYVANPSRPARVGSGDGYEIYAVRWQVLDGIFGEGLLLEPTNKPPIAHVVSIPDCEQTPEQLVGLVAGVPPESQFARRLAESGCRVVVPLLIDRGNNLSVIADGKRRSKVTHRELLYRAAYQMGHHLIGYEVQKVLAAVDWFENTSGKDNPRIAVVGYGEGGLVALYSAALDQRIDVVGVSGYFSSREKIWQEPIDRNIFGLLREFGDAEIASLIAPRTLIVEACKVPDVNIPPGTQSAPARLTTPPVESVRKEIRRAIQLTAALNPKPMIELVVSGDGGGVGDFGSASFLETILHHVMSTNTADAKATAAKTMLAEPRAAPVAEHDPAEHDPRADQRLARQFKQLATFSQQLVDRSDQTRDDFTAKIERSSGVELFEKSTESYRQYFRDEIVGPFDRELLPANARTRLIYDEPKYLGYEVVLDVFEELTFYGILLLPKNIGEDEKRPVVVCQHGLEGRAQSTVTGDHTSYRDFASRLANRGFIVFAPQHLYRGGDRFRTLQRKANPLKKSLFSIMVAQHRQLLSWLGDLDSVDRERIGFYGISYGGKSAMRIPALLDGYCLSICSSDFSDWIWRTATNRYPNGYLAHSEYEIFEFGLGNTFNYPEQAALICPRPFMVERFHHHGLFAEKTCAEFAKVQLLYENLDIADRVAMTYYGSYLNNKPYTDRETFDFLHKHLRWAP
jgi:dienelactone hydrolase